MTQLPDGKIDAGKDQSENLGSLAPVLIQNKASFQMRHQLTKHSLGFRGSSSDTPLPTKEGPPPNPWRAIQEQ
ncbi:hypothetical protein GCM10007924_09780 [Sneathiella chinensis]|uniref:Uncharacterized protein n=1 Tax=Sneathiella chinensis TaxID=349750 RepID=A0ABQ5U333_9PROT|nr:hypothetical protein GCM10007924_09780 [Sneathiella chinensis]